MLRSPVSSPVSRRASRLAAPLFGAALGLASAACPASPGAGTDDTESDADTNPDTTLDSADDPTAEGGTGDAPWMEVGWGQNEYSPLAPGGRFDVVFGTQGSAMFPIIVRGGNFALPADPGDWQDEAAPILELWLDIEGHNDGIGSHFKRIANYQTAFTILEDGTYESTFIAILLPDDKSPEALDGLPATLWIQLDPIDTDPIEVQLELVVGLGDLPG